MTLKAHGGEGTPDIFSNIKGEMGVGTISSSPHAYRCLVGSALIYPAILGSSSACVDFESISRKADLAEKQQSHNKTFYLLWLW